MNGTKKWVFLKAAVQKNQSILFSWINRSFYRVGKVQGDCAARPQFPELSV